MEWFKKARKPKRPVKDKKVILPEGLWIKCDSCKEIIYKKEVVKNSMVCPKCNHHFKLDHMSRLKNLVDGEGFEIFGEEILSSDPLKFKDTMAYKERIRVTMEKKKRTEAIICAKGTIEGIPAIVCVMDFSFLGGSLGSAVGERITVAIERAIEERLPVIIVSASGGARMQEGVLSLMQMAKISAALARLDDEKIPFISILTNPTTGGVTASYAMLGDLNIAEPGALIGFAGPRVIEQTIRQKLPEGFQKSEFVLDHGMLDFIVERRDMKKALARALRFMLEKREEEKRAESPEPVAEQERKADDEGEATAPADEPTMPDTSPESQTQTTT